MHLPWNWRHHERRHSHHHLQKYIESFKHAFSSQGDEAEKEYVHLLFEVTNCYASWEPLIPVCVGDYGSIQEDGSFIREGNIFDLDPEKLAEECHGGVKIIQAGTDDIHLSVSKDLTTLSDATQLSLDALKNGSFKWDIQCHNARHKGAALCMLYPHLTMINYPHRLLGLLSRPEWKDYAVVSEPTKGSISLKGETDDEKLVNVEGHPHIRWAVDGPCGDFKWAFHDKAFVTDVGVPGENEENAEEGDPSTLCYPLFKLVAPDPHWEYGVTNLSPKPA